MTFATIGIVYFLDRIKSKQTYSHRRDAILVQTFLYTPIHAFKMPLDKVPTNSENNFLPLCNGACCEASEVPQIPWIK